jgi:hypothetical protein
MIGAIDEQSSAMMRGEQPERDPRDRGEAAPRPIFQDPAEAKRLEARRRLLLGGGAAISALVTMSPGRLGAVTYSECAARFPELSQLIIDAAHNRGQVGSDQAGFLCQIFGGGAAE